MKKGLALLTAAAMCFSLTACSHKSSQNDRTSSKTVKAVSSAISSVVSSEVSSAASSAVASSAPISSAPVSSAPVVQTVTVTIPPGYCVQQIAAKLESAGVCAQSDFYSAVNNYPFTEASMGQIPYDASKMCFRLEGYLYPDTYEFNKNMKAEDAVGKMLRDADSHIVGKYSYQTVVLASLIEKEAPDKANMKKVSSVFHNRLNNPKQYPYLGSEATVYYLTIYIANVDKAMGSGLVDKYKYYYNTQSRIKGLPVGPICSPGPDALDAAANPDSTNYYNFGSDSAGAYHFS